MAWPLLGISRNASLQPAMSDVVHPHLSASSTYLGKTLTESVIVDRAFMVEFARHHTSGRESQVLDSSLI